MRFRAMRKAHGILWFTFSITYSHCFAGTRRSQLWAVDNYKTVLGVNFKKHC